MKKRTCLSKIKLVSMLFIFIACSSPSFSANRVIVISWDGADYWTTRQLYNQGKLPYLASIGPIRQLTSTMQNDMYAVTAAQHATMLTGVSGDVHGNFTNNELHLIPEGLTVYEKIRASRPEVKLAHISSALNFIGLPTFENAANITDEFQAYHTKTQWGGVSRGQTEITDIVLNILDNWQDESFFIFMHYSEPDHTGHDLGYQSTEYKTELRFNDMQLGRIKNKLAALKITDVKFMILSDHGFGSPTETTHARAPATFFVANEGTSETPITKDYYMDEIAGKILRKLGVPD